MKDEDVFRFIEQAYSAALAPEMWPAILAELASAIGGPLATILPLNRPSLVMTSPGFDQAVSVYSEHWWRSDSILSEVLSRRNAKGILCDWKMIEGNAIARDPFYQEFRRDFGLGHWVGANLELYPGELYSFAVQLAHGRQPLDAADCNRMEIVARHVGKAMAITGRLSDTGIGQPELVDALSRLRGAAAILKANGTVLVVNAALERLASDGVQIVHGRLQTARSHDQAKLDRLIRDAGNVSPCERSPSLILLERPSGLRPFLVRAIPLAAKHVGRLGIGQTHKGQVLVIIADLDGENLSQPLESLQLLGLTHAEARVATLVGLGRSLKATADALGSSEGTVRNQLKQVFSKLSLSRQSELVRLIDRLSLLGKA